MSKDKSSDIPAAVGKRAAELRALLTRANRAYYVDASPIMSDPEFDRLLAELAKIEAEHPSLRFADSPTVRVGGEAIEGFRQIRHAEPMLSIDNTYDLASLGEWHERVLRGLGIEGGSSLFGGGESGVVFVCDPKIDGVALSVRYERGELVHAVTRGDGETGDDVTHAARTLRALPLKLEGKGVPEVLEVRGEVYMPSREFERINQEREKAGDDLFMNPRNATAGTLKNLDPKVAASRKLAFCVHGKGRIEPSDFAKGHAEFLEKCKALGFPTNPHTRTCTSVEEIGETIKAFETKRAGLDYATDGMVVRVDSFAQQKKLGVTSKSPRWIVAYKYPAERKTTRLLKVEHQVGKTGKITPRATMEPVLIAGTMVQHATLHNYGRVRAMPTTITGETSDVRIGDLVYVEKAGEIIPQVVQVVAMDRPADATPVVAPEVCPECGSPVEWEYDQKRVKEIEQREALPTRISDCASALSTAKQTLLRSPRSAKAKGDVQKRETRLAELQAELAKPPPHPLGPEDETARFCLNPECPAQIREKLVWFGGRRQMDIEGLGEQTIDLIRRSGGIPLKSFGDVFRLRDYRSSLMQLHGLGEKKVDTILGAIELAKSRGMARLLAGMGIRHVGDATAKSLARHFASIWALIEAETDLLMPKSLKKDRARALGLPEESADRPETGLGKETAPSVHRYLRSATARKLFHDLESLGVSLNSIEYATAGKDAGTPKPLAGRSFVMTGTLESFGRDDLREKLESLGASVLSSVSKNTSVLIAGDSPGSKLDKARSLGIEVWDEKRLLKELEGLG